jgi:hypothetical protein
MFSNLSSWFYGSNVTEKNDEFVTESCPDSLIEVDENFEPIEIDESDDWVILGKGKLSNNFIVFIYFHTFFLLNR